MFSAARLQLTVWYLAVLTPIVVLLSLALYDVSGHEQAEAQVLGRGAYRTTAWPGSSLMMPACWPFSSA